MSETWEEYKKKKQAELGLIISVNSPSLKHDHVMEDEPKDNIPRFNIHKRSLPVGVDKIVVFNETKQWAEWWVEHRLKTKCYEDYETDSKTLIYYDIIPVGATPKERSIYYNMRPLVTEEVPGFDSPKRIN